MKAKKHESDCGCPKCVPEPRRRHASGCICGECAGKRRKAVATRKADLVAAAGAVSAFRARLKALEAGIAVASHNLGRLQNQLGALLNALEGED